MRTIQPAYLPDLRQRHPRQEGMKPTRVQGIGLWMVLFLTLVVILWVIALVKLVPEYYKGHSVHSFFETYTADSTNRVKSDDQITRDIEKQLQINALSADLIEYLEIEPIKTEAGLKQRRVTFNYEERVPFMHNISFLLTWQNEAVIDREK